MGRSGGVSEQDGVFVAEAEEEFEDELVTDDGDGLPDEVRAELEAV